MTKAEKYQKAALELLELYFDAAETEIGEFSSDFEASAHILNKKVLKYLRKLDVDEAYFDTIAKDSWLFEGYLRKEVNEHDK